MMRGFFPEIATRKKVDRKLWCSSYITTYLLGFHDADTLQKSPHFGNLFETMIINDFLKKFLHFGERASMYYLRSRDGLEVDLVIEIGGFLHLFEIKSSMTITPKHITSLKRLANDLGSKVKTAAVISCSDGNFMVKDNIANYSWKNILTI